LRTRREDIDKTTVVGISQFSIVEGGGGNGEGSDNASGGFGVSIHVVVTGADNNGEAIIVGEVVDSVIEGPVRRPHANAQRDNSRFPTALEVV
jgi:hypothetical protein